MSKTKHGLSNTRLYKVWMGMKRRCNNPNCRDYKYYGERGIKVCSEWLDFAVFYEWAITTGYDATAPRGMFTIDRIDNDDGYSPENCRWIPLAEQLAHRRFVEESRAKPRVSYMDQNTRKPAQSEQEILDILDWWDYRDRHRIY